jgi:hypothetical protein
MEAITQKSSIHTKDNLNNRLHYKIKYRKKKRIQLQINSQ